MKTYTKLGLGILSVLAVLVANIYYQPPTEHTHIHAGFKVYINDEPQDYSHYKYMNFTACSEHDNKKSAAEEQIEKAHLHDGVGDVVHIHRLESTWGDLFANIKVALPKDGLKGFINGSEVEDILNQPIESYSTAIFVVGESKMSHANETVTIEHIKEVEAKSELCGT